MGNYNHEAFEVSPEIIEEYESSGYESPEEEQLEEFYEAQAAEYHASQAEFEVQSERMRVFSSENPNFPLVYASEMFKVPRVAPEPILENIIYPGALTIFAGDPKAGKSTFLFHALQAMKHREKCCGLNTKALNVVYASEQTDNSLFSQISEFKGMKTNSSLAFIPFENNKALRGSEFFYPENWSQQVAIWEDAVKKAKAGLLVIDTFSSFAQFEAGEASDAGPVTSRLQELKSLISARPGLGIVLCHHLRKAQSNGGDWRARNFADVANSYALLAASDMNAILFAPSKKEEDKNLREILVQGRMLGKVPQPFKVQYRLIDDQLVEEGNALAHRRDKSELQERILAAVQADPDRFDQLSIEKLARELSIFWGEPVAPNQARVFRGKYPKGSIKPAHPVALKV
jgi:hypothetical protein